MDILSQLLPMFGNLAFTLAAFFAALMVIVAIHEYGHYRVGRACGIHPEVFSLGMGPVLLRGRDKRGTVWQLAALPIGGYVQFAGDANPAGMGESEDLAPQRSMANAPLWARAATVFAGPMANFIFAIVVFAGLGLAQGQLAPGLTVGEMRALPDSYGQDLQVNDEILAIAGIEMTDPVALFAALDELPAETSLPYTVLRDGVRREARGPYPMPALVDGISPRSAAYAAGIKVGDVITAVDGQPITRFEQLRQLVEAGQGREMELILWRDGDYVTRTLSPKRTDMPAEGGGFEARFLIGVTGAPAFVPAVEAMGIGTAIGHGAQITWSVLTSSLSGLWHIVTGAISSCNLSSPVGIAETSGAMASQGATAFIGFIGFLSVAIGMFNLLPIPVLDGGHLVFYAYEAVSGRKPSARAVRLAMSFGMSLLLTLMGFALLNDIWLCR